MTMPLSCDLAIVGGGLAGGLIARAFAVKRPQVRLLLVEQGAALGGNHLWSFFDGDIADKDRWLVDPLVAHRWTDGHMVAFPGHGRMLPASYNSITSAQFDTHLRGLLGERVVTGAAAQVRPDGVTLSDGRSITAAAVIDARGQADLSALHCGWQKFVGRTMRLSAPHGLTRPVIMDATVEQIDGYRFVYLLPMGPDRIFVEDTYYSDDASLDVPRIRNRISAYAMARGWRVEALEHEETGVLPVVYGGDFDRFWPAADPVARAGVGAGLFHPMTGYSLPDAVAFALHLADRWPLDGKCLAEHSRAWAKAHWRSGGYYRLLGTMLFRAAAPAQRYKIFERFYRLSPGLIGRFYAGRSTPFDKGRILCGRPPVPIRDAMHAILNRSA